MAVPFKKTSIYKKKLKKNKFNKRLLTPLKYCYFENEKKFNFFKKKLKCSNKYIIYYFMK